MLLKALWQRRHRLLPAIFASKRSRVVSASLGGGGSKEPGGRLVGSGGSRSSHRIARRRVAPRWKGLVVSRLETSSAERKSKPSRVPSGSVGYEPLPLQAFT